MRWLVYQEHPGQGPTYLFLKDVLSMKLSNMMDGVRRE
jgi:hypothetical protein